MVRERRELSSGGFEVARERRGLNLWRFPSRFGASQAQPPTVSKLLRSDLGSISGRF